MTESRNPDRLIRAWLDLMPSEAPDRVVSAVLQAIDMTPQVRTWRWLPRRIPPMNRAYYAIGAATIVVVVAGALLLTQPSTAPDVGGSPKPTVTETPSAPTLEAAALPPELRARWMGGERAVPGIIPVAGTILNFTDESDFFITQSNQNEDHYLNSTASTAGAGRFRLETTRADDSCSRGEAGLYSWSISTSGRILSITGERDDCATRLGALPGVWWLEACRQRDTNCLGELDAGTYASQYVRPLLPKGSAWAPRFGALSYSVPEGWANSADWPMTFELTPASEFAVTTASAPEPENRIFVITEVVAASQSPACAATSDPRIDATPQAIAAWLSNLAELHHSATSPITIGGLTGVYLDLTVNQAAAPSCGDDLVEYLVSGGEGHAIAGDEKQRLILLDAGSAGVLAIRIETTASAEFELFAAEAMPIVESFTFE